MKKLALYSAAWLVAVVLATGAALAAVQAVGEAARGRGPLGQEIAPLQQDAPAQPSAPGTDKVTASSRIEGDFGTFVVACQGPYAVGLRVLPDKAKGWRALSFEPGPDDDVDAVFTNTRRSVEVEVFCDQGRPVVADIENSRFTDYD